MPRSKYGRGWYTVCKRINREIHLVDGPHPTKKAASDGYSRALDSVAFGKFPYGTEIALLGAGEIERRWDTIVDRRQEFAGDGQELQEGTETSQA